MWKSLSWNSQGLLEYVFLDHLIDVISNEIIRGLKLIGVRRNNLGKRVRSATIYPQISPTALCLRNLNLTREINLRHFDDNSCVTRTY